MSVEIIKSSLSKSILVLTMISVTSMALCYWLGFSVYSLLLSIFLIIFFSSIEIANHSKFILYKNHFIIEKPFNPFSPKYEIILSELKSIELTGFRGPIFKILYWNNKILLINFNPFEKGGMKLFSNYLKDKGVKNLAFNNN